MKKYMFFNLFVSVFLLLFCTGVFADEQLDISEKDILESKYNDLKKFSCDEIEYGFTKDHQGSGVYDGAAENKVEPIVSYEYEEGILGGDIEDFDNDGYSELVVFRFSPGKISENTDEQKTNTIEIDMYRVKNGEAVKTTQTTGMDYVFAEGEGGICCFIKCVGDKKYICIQNTDTFFIDESRKSYGSSNITKESYKAKININVFEYDNETIKKVLNYGKYYNVITPFPQTENSLYNYFCGGRTVSSSNTMEDFKNKGFEITYYYEKTLHNPKTFLNYNKFNVALIEDDVKLISEIVFSTNAYECYYDKDIYIEKAVKYDNVCNEGKVNSKIFNYTNFNDEFINNNRVMCYIDYKPVGFDEVWPVKGENGYLLPLKELAAEIYYISKYIPEEKKLILENGDNNIILKNEEPYCIKNDIKIELSKSPQIIDGRFMVSDKLFGEIFGYRINTSEKNTIKFNKIIN